MRRSLVLYALLFAAPALGAELVRPRIEPVQLSLPFAAPIAAATLTAPTPVTLSAPLSMTPAPAPAAAALSAVAAPAPAPVAAAVASPAPASTLPKMAPRRDEGEDGRSQLQRLARNADDPGGAFDAPRRATKMDYDEFGRQLAVRPGLSLNPFDHADAKRRMLAASGYTHLFGAGGRRVPLAEASDVRVGKAFLSVKKTYDRRPRPSAK